jgi:hypothetical protein
VACDKLVERRDDGSCPASHPAEAVTGDVRVEAGEPGPRLPRFNWAAFALPPVWGVAHGQWAGAFFLPIWLFADSILATARMNAVTRVAAVVVVAATLAFQAYFAKRANGIAWRRVWQQVSVEEFARSQRYWAYACVPVGLALAGLVIGYRAF